MVQFSLVIRTLLSYVPPSADGSYLVFIDQNLDQMIDDTLEEISSMAAGASGYAGGFVLQTILSIQTLQIIKTQSQKRKNDKDGDNYSTMNLKRDQIIAEELIREHIRKRIKNRLNEQIIAEQNIRTYVRRLLETEAGTVSLAALVLMF